jgi:hypothetical protein
MSASDTSRFDGARSVLIKLQRDGRPSDVSPQARLIPWNGRAAITTLAPYAMAVVSTVWFFRRTLATGMLPGNRGDARWTIAVYEHWFEVWQGDETLRTIPFFFPTENTLGMSDAYLVQGQLHALARVLGLDHVGAWTASTIGIYLVGALGLAFLSTLTFRSAPFRCAFVALSCLSYPIMAMIGHPQLAGFLSVSWIFAGAILLFRHADGKLGVYLLILTTPLLVLSSWYAAILGWLTLLTTGGFLVLVTPSDLLKQSLSRFRSNLRASLRPWRGWLAWVGSAALWGLAVWIYLPARHSSPPTKWEEVVFYSPRLSDLLNAAGDGGGVWGPLYDAVYDSAVFNGERELGFTPLLLSAMLIAGGAGLRRLAVASAEASTGPSRSRLSSAAMCVAGVFTVLGLAMITVVDDAGRSLFRLLWESIPGFDAIRAPFRIQLALYVLAIFVVMIALEAWLLRRPRDFSRYEAFSFRRARAGLLGRWIVAGLVSFGILVEMHREVALHWSAADLAPPELVAQIPTIRDSCGAIVLNGNAYRDETPIWEPALSAVMLSMLAEVPTPDGYSRSAPIGHPGIGARPAALIAWMRAEGYDGNVCVVSPTAPLEIVPATT